MKNTENIILTPELVPSSSWYSNLRSILTERQWRLISKNVREKAAGKCVICGTPTPMENLDAHETWEYEPPKTIGARGTQKLLSIRAVCDECHLAIHFGYASTQCREKEAFAHLMKVNKISSKRCEDMIDLAFIQWTQRSHLEWDIMIPDDIVSDIIDEAPEFRALTLPAGRIYYYVPFREKDEFKILNGRFDREHKLWYLTEDNKSRPEADAKWGRARSMEIEAHDGYHLIKSI